MQQADAAIGRATAESMAELLRLARQMPVLAEVHPLLPLAFDPEVQIETDGRALLNLLDSRSASIPEGPLIILDDKPLLRARFPFMRAVASPSAESINLNFAQHLDYARTRLLTNHGVAKWIENDVTRHMSDHAGQNHPDVIALLLVDGLSYGDVLDWHWTHLEPCFVDGPSVTFRFHKEDSLGINERVGFAAIINRPSIHQRLYRLGFRTARGYTYWTPGSNEIADYMFSGLPFLRVANFEAVLGRLQREELHPGTYVQIVREGLDGLAHGKRELLEVEVDGAKAAIQRDIERLMDVLCAGGRRAALYVTADHGVLWKIEHVWQSDDAVRSDHARYFESAPPKSFAAHTVSVENGGEKYSLCKHPWLAGSIPANDSGVHGGLSYQESIVPMGKLQG